MSIRSNLFTIQDIKREMHTSITEKGVTVPNDTPLSEYPSKVQQIIGESSCCILKPIISPSDAQIIFTDINNNPLAGFQKQAAIAKGSTIKWTCSKNGYISQTGSELMTNNKEINISLVAYEQASYNFTTSGSYKIPENAFDIQIICVGGGGGAGGKQSPYSNPGKPGGGGSGAVSTKNFGTSLAGKTVSYTVGAAGSFSASSDGGSGGTSSCQGLSATGGSGGSMSPGTKQDGQCGYGGVARGGDTNTNGSTGTYNRNVYTAGSPQNSSGVHYGTGSYQYGGTVGCINISYKVPQE